MQPDPEQAEAAADAQDPPILWMSVSFPESFTIEEIRAAFGDPSHIVPFAGVASLAHSTVSVQYYELTLVYLAHGFFLQTERALGAPPYIDPSMALSTGVEFFPPTSNGLDGVSESLRNGWSSAELLPWQGFRDFSTYCRQVRPSDNLSQYCPNIGK